MVSITEANQNFSKVARLVDTHGNAIILKNNSPKYIIIEFDETEKQFQLDNTKIYKYSKLMVISHSK